MKIFRSRQSSAHSASTQNKEETNKCRKLATLDRVFGTNIAATVDVKAVAEALKGEPGVVFSTDYQVHVFRSGTKP